MRVVDSAETEDCPVFPVRSLCAGDQLFQQPWSEKSRRRLESQDTIISAMRNFPAKADHDQPECGAESFLAVEILMERINGVEKERENEIELPVTLIPRKSLQPQEEEKSKELHSKSTENLKYKDVKSRNIRELSVSDSQSIFGFFW